MKKLTILFIAFTLSACETEADRVQANDNNRFRAICIDGLSYLTCQGGVIKNFLQIYVPAEDQLIRHSLKPAIR